MKVFDDRYSTLNADIAKSKDSSFVMEARSAVVGGSNIRWE